MKTSWWKAVKRKDFEHSPERREKQMRLLVLQGTEEQ